MTGSQREAINILMMMESVTVNADLIAQALGMNPGVLRKRVRDGNYLISKYDFNKETGRIRFFRKDFLQAIGEVPPDPPEITDSDRLDSIIQLLADILSEIKKETADAATSTVRKDWGNEQP